MLLLCLQNFQDFVIFTFLIFVSRTVVGNKTIGNVQGTKW
jgi:hypothetical protein